MVVAKVSAIQDISLSPVLMSGAGTSMPGPAEPHKGQGAGWLISSDSSPTDEAFLGQFDGESSGDLLQLVVLKTDTQSKDQRRKTKTTEMKLL